MLSDTLFFSRMAKYLAVFSLLVLATGCTVSPTLAVAVDAISTERAADDARYQLKPVVDGVDDADLHYLEYAEHIHTALQSLGLRRAESAAEAAIEIEVNYGAGSDQRLVVVPGLRSSPFRTHRYCSHRDPGGRCRLWQTRRLHDPWDVFDRRHRDHVRVVPYYRLFLTLEAFSIGSDSDSDSGRSAIWIARAKMASGRSDLRAAMPALVAAVSDYIGKDTEREVLVVLPRSQ